MTEALSTTPPSFHDDPEAALAGYLARGFHIEPGLVPDAFCDRLIATGNAKPSARDGTFKPIAMPHRVDPVFLEMLRFRPIVAIVEHLVGGRASGLGGDYSYMQPGTPGWFAHQDNLYIEAPPDQLLSVWTALCDVDAENGGMVLYPGSHRLGLLPIERLPPTTHPGQNRSAEAIRSILPTGLAALPTRLRKGTSLFFHSLLVHESRTNTTPDRFRYSYLATYIGVGQPFRPGTMQVRTEVDLYGA